MYGFVLIFAFLAAALVLVLLNTVWSAVPLGGMEEWLRFSDAWGTDRIGVWKYCLALFGKFPLWKKLIGGGCGVLAALDVRHRYFPDAILDTAHCEYIQLLLNWGVLGLGAYLAWIVLALRRALKKGGAFSFALDIRHIFRIVQQRPRRLAAVPVQGHAQRQSQCNEENRQMEQNIRWHPMKDRSDP